MAKWYKTKYPGVRYRKHPTRRHGVKMDRYYSIYYRVDGKRKEEGLGWASQGWTESKAIKQLSDIKEAIRTGTGPQSLAEKREIERVRREAELKRKMEEARENITLGEVWEHYNEWLETGKRRPRDDRSIYRNHIKKRFAKVPLSKISPFDLERMKAELLKKGKAPATVKHCLVLVRQIINKAIAWGLWYGENPVKKVKLPRLNNQRVRFLSYEEAEILLNHLKTVSSQLHDIALLSLHTGMRAGEIFNLKWQHIDLENGIIHVADPKSGRSRTTHMTETVKTMFQTIQRGDLEDFVFKSRKGGKILGISKSFSRVIKQLGFNDGITDPRQRVTFHTLRHTFASWLAIEGTPILTIKELLGHQTLAMTERYSHLIPDTKKEAINIIEKKMKKRGSVTLLHSRKDG